MLTHHGLVAVFYFVEHTSYICYTCTCILFMILKYYLIQKHINHFISEYILLQEKMFRIPGKERFLKELRVGRNKNSLL